MARTKGTGIGLIRRMFSDRGPEAESRLLAQLTDEERAIYNTASPMSWVSVEVLTQVFVKAAPLLFPGKDKPLQRFARVEAQDHLGGIYRLLLPFVTIPFLVNKTARLWDTYYDKGLARSEWQAKEKKAVLVVEGFPELPAANRREIVSGYLIGTLELTGAQNIEVLLDESNAQRWQWIVTWR